MSDPPGCEGGGDGAVGGRVGEGEGEDKDKEEEEETSELPTGPAATESTSDGESAEVEDGYEEDTENTAADTEDV